MLYVLDEPSIGLHQRDNDRLLVTLTRLRDLGNTVLVVEHDEEAIRAADYLVDIGPRAGVLGGEVVAEGRPAEVMANPKSLTGQYLSGAQQIDVPQAMASQIRSASCLFGAQAGTTCKMWMWISRSACSSALPALVALASQP